MAEITVYKGYQLDETPVVPRPESPVDPEILTVRDGLPLVFPGCYGLAVRVVHPTNPRAPARNMSLTMFYIPPHVVNEVGSHPTEETYAILEGRGEMTFTRFKREVKKGDFIYLPAWCEHGIENTGDEMLVVLVVTSPPNPRGAASRSPGRGRSEIDQRKSAVISGWVQAFPFSSHDRSMRPTSDQPPAVPRRHDVESIPSGMMSRSWQEGRGAPSASRGLKYVTYYISYDFIYCG